MKINYTIDRSSARRKLIERSANQKEPERGHTCEHRRDGDESIITTSNSIFGKLATYRYDRRGHLLTMTNYSEHFDDQLWVKRSTDRIVHRGRRMCARARNQHSGKTHKR